MKKLLFSILAVGLTSTSTFSVISCGDRTHNRDFSKNNLQVYSSSELSHIGILENSDIKAGQEAFEWNAARALENDVYLPIVEKDFEFIYYNADHEVITSDKVDFGIGKTIIFQIVAKTTSENFEDKTMIIEAVTFQDSKKDLKDRVLQSYLKDFKADIEKPDEIFQRIKRFNNHLICNSKNMEIVSVIEAQDGETGTITIKGTSSSLHYTDTEFQLTYI
ncbi:hypothetical protein [Spiroplasma endosymbiont of Panorpa germanica]|uniref:hypothetical protein n=1 Tax=Spiroplasma endosymbiont of Panorpa germanica TaxID=3066314 RepID=UPI0030CCB00D